MLDQLGDVVAKEPIDDVDIRRRPQRRSLARLAQGMRRVVLLGITAPTNAC
jgi:hypothetical protein